MGAGSGPGPPLQQVGQLPPPGGAKSAAPSTTLGILASVSIIVGIHRDTSGFECVLAHPLEGFDSNNEIEPISICHQFLA